MIYYCFFQHPRANHLLLLLRASHSALSRLPRASAAASSLLGIGGSFPQHLISFLASSTEFISSGSMNYSIQVSRESKELLESATIESLCLFSDELMTLAKRAKLEQPKPPAVSAPAPSRPAQSAKPPTSSAKAPRDQAKLPRPPSVPVPVPQPSTVRSQPAVKPSHNRADSIRRKGLDSSAAIKADTYRIAPPAAPDQPPPFVNYAALLLSLHPFSRVQPRKSSTITDKPQAL